MAYLRDRRAFGNIGTRKFRGARFGDALSPRGPQYTLEGRVLDYSTDVGPFTIVDQSGEGNTATLYSGRGLTMDAVNDTVTYATGYSLANRTATLWGRFNTTSTVTMVTTQSGSFSFTPTATGVWEKLTATSQVSGDLFWLNGQDFDIGDLRIGTEHWTHNDWSDPTGDTSNGKTIVDSGPNQLHGTCTGCSGFTGEGIDPEVAGIVGLDDARWFNGVDAEVILSTGITLTGDFDISLTFIGVDQSSGGHFFADTAVAAVARGFFTASDIRLITSTDPALTATVTFDRGAHTVRFRRSSGTAYIDFDGVNLTSAASTGSLVITGIGSVRGAGATSTPTFNGVMLGVDFGTAAYTGRGATPWVDTIGTNDGTESGTFVSVGQKRATIPQTADKNWNKYQWFNGVDSKVAFGDTQDKDGSTAFFIEATILIAHTSTSAIVDKQASSGSFQGYSFRVAGGELFLTIGDSVSSRITVVTAGANLNDGAVHVCRVTYDGSKSASGVSFLVDGVSQSVSIDTDAFTGNSSSTGINLSIGIRDANGALPFKGKIYAVNINDQLAVTGIGNTPWADTIGSNDGTEAGTFTRELVSASDANDQIDALGTAILEPRLNTQQLNLFGDGEYSSTPDSASLDLTTAATWELWGNFYGDIGATEIIFSKDISGAANRGWNINKVVGEAANRMNISVVNSSNNGTSAYFQLGLLDQVQHVVYTFTSGVLKCYVDSVEVTLTKYFGATPTSSLPNVSYPVMIGAFNDPTPTAFAERAIGSAKIYNTALTAAEVLTNYNTQKSLYGL